MNFWFFERPAELAATMMLASVCANCYAFCCFSMEMAFGEALELTQKTEWRFLDPSAEPQKRRAVPDEAKPYLRGVPRTEK